MKHPSITRLALYSGGELSFLAQCATQWHIRSCPQCQSEVHLFQMAAADAAQETFEMPAGVQWDRLGGEMRANIRLGLEASDAISAYPSPLATQPALGKSWKLAACAAAFGAILVAGYWLSAVKRTERVAALRGPEPVLVEASGRAVGLLQGNQGLELQGPKDSLQVSVVSVSTGGAAAATYVDEETGQVTVNHVYMD